MSAYTSKEDILKVEGLEVGYYDKSGDKKVILKNINILEKDIVREGIESTGQIIAFIGRSGRGKSTLFKALTGLIKPFEGNVKVADLTSDQHPLKDIHEGDIGFVDQKYTLFRHKTIYQICKYALRKSDLSNDEKDALIDKYLKEWGLDVHRNKYSSELSGGQKQRTAIIEQMLTSKRFMIFDEPFSGLDVGNIEKVKESFEKILSSNEYNTIIFSTHDIRLAAELADSIYIIGFPDEKQEYSTVIKHFNLKEMGLAWKEYGDGHRTLVREIKELLLKS
jgi:polar amino acid transport system ATP-binding protein